MVVLLANVVLALSIAGSSIGFVPMYATPAARQLPIMLGAIAGVRVVEPPQQWLGDYITPGDVGKIAGWLLRAPVQHANAFVISTDMLAYGGLDPSRIPGGVSTSEALSRLQPLRLLRARKPRAWIAAFGTVMRLEPTVVVPVGAAASYSPIAQPPAWQYIWDYAQLHDPPLAEEQERASHLRQLIGPTLLSEYLQARDRDRDVDLAVLHLVADGTLDRAVIGADDAGPVGLHVRDIRALQEAVNDFDIGDRASVEPGADELGSVLVAHAMARMLHWQPRIAVRYSTPEGAATQDPLEFAPISVTIDNIIRLCGGMRDDSKPDIVLYVRVAGTTATQDADLLQTLSYEIRSGHSVALVDLTFLNRSYDAQASFVRQMLQTGIAGTLDAYSSWNTDANSVGIALSEAVATGVGRRAATYDPLAHAAFMFDRYIDDYLYHDSLRPELNAYLAKNGVPDHEYLAPDVAREANQKLRELIVPKACDLLRELYPNYRATKLNIILPWPRTFEIESDIRLAPNVGSTHLNAHARATLNRPRSRCPAPFPEICRLGLRLRSRLYR